MSTSIIDRAGFLGAGIASIGCLLMSADYIINRNNQTVYYRFTNYYLRIISAGAVLMSVDSSTRFFSKAFR